jgi:hypothetical protein
MDKITAKENEDPKMNEVKLKDKLLQKLVKEISVDSEFLLELFDHNEIQIKRIVAEFKTKRLATTTEVDQGIGIVQLSKADNAEIFMSVGGFYKEYMDKIDKETKVEEDRKLSNDAKEDQIRTNKRIGVGTIITISISILALGITLFTLIK